MTKPINQRARALKCRAATLLAALTVAACGGSDGGGTAPGGQGQGTGGAGGQAGSASDGGPVGTSTGGGANGAAPLGGRCTDDSECEAGLRCLTPLFAGSDRYCGSPCSTSDECKALDQTSYTFQVPLTYNRFLGDPRTNAWNTEYLGRGSACAPIGGKAGEPSFCQFVCPDLSAAIVENGTISGCACLPGYTMNQDHSACVPNPDVQCSIFSYLTPDSLALARDKYGIAVSPVRCDACNSDMSSADTINCHTGRFICDLQNDGLEGRCTEVFTDSELNSCINDQVYQTCDCQCPDVSACLGGGTSIDCACCTCTSLNSPPPRPVCTTGTTGTGGGPGSGGTAGSGGTSGGSGGTVSSGGTSGGGSGGTSGGGSGGFAGGGSGSGGAP